MPSEIRLFLSFSNKSVKSPTETLELALLDLLPPMVRLRLPVARLRETALPRLGESAPLSRATVRLLLARHLVLRHRRVRHLILRHRLVHRRLVLLRLVLRRGVALRVDAVHLVGAELHAVVLRVVDLRGEAPRRAVVASRRVDAGWQADVVLVVDEVPRRRLL